MISEGGQDRNSEKTLIVEDQDFLKSIEDEFVFSNIGTNEFIAQSRSPKYFNDICVDILTTNGNPEEKIQELVSYEKERGYFTNSFLGHDIAMEIDYKILTSCEWNDYNDDLTKALMNGEDSGLLHFDGFSYWWKKVKKHNDVDKVYEVSQLLIHGERLCSFGLFKNKDNAFDKAVEGFEELYIDFKESLSENGTNQWLYEGKSKETKRDAYFLFSIREINLDKFEEI